MGPDREMAEAEADVSKGGSERVEEGGDLRERAKAHWEASTNGHDSHRDLGYGSSLSLLFKKLVIEVPGHGDWGSLGVLVARPCCIREAITRSWSTPFRGYTSHPRSPPLSSPSIASLNT